MTTSEFLTAAPSREAVGPRTILPSGAALAIRPSQQRRNLQILSEPARPGMAREGHLLVYHRT
jgi:hypothetical protein